MSILVRPIFGLKNTNLIFRRKFFGRPNKFGDKHGNKWLGLFHVSAKHGVEIHVLGMYTIITAW